LSSWAACVFSTSTAQPLNKKTDAITEPAIRPLRMEVMRGNDHFITLL
jgi:hypothetical protein